MYPVSLGFEAAVSRISNLLQSGHETESLVTCAFTVEKTLRRTLRQLIVSSGFVSKVADRVVGGYRGLEAIKNNWDIYDPSHKKLLDIISSNDWKVVKHSAEMRNKLVHGERVYSVATCSVAAEEAILAMRNIKNSLESEYGYSGWTVASSRKKSMLHSDPKVRISRIE